MPEVIRYPFGHADKQTIAQAATMAATIKNSVTILDLGTLAQASTLNLTIDAGVRDGDRLFIKVASDGTARNLTLGTGLSGNAIAGTISKTNLVSLVFIDSAFVVEGVQLQN